MVYCEKCGFELDGICDCDDVAFKETGIHVSIASKDDNDNFVNSGVLTIPSVDADPDYDHFVD